MKIRLFAYFWGLFSLVVMLTACGGGGGGGGDSTPPPTLAVAASKPIAFNNGTDGIQITVSFPSAVGADTAVTLAATNGATLPATATVFAGQSSATANMTSTTAGLSTVTATAANYTASSKTVKFITLAEKPDRAEVFVATNVAFPDLNVLGAQMDVNVTGTNSTVVNATEPSVLLNEALAAYNAAQLFPPPSNGDVNYEPLTPPFTANTSVTIALVNAKTATTPVILNLVASKNFMRINMDITAVDAVPYYTIHTGFTAVIYQGTNISVADSVIIQSVDYYQGATKLNP